MKNIIKVACLISVVIIFLADFVEPIVASTTSDDASQVVDVGRTVVDGESYDVMVPVQQGETVNSAWKSKMLATVTRKLKKKPTGKWHKKTSIVKCVAHKWSNYIQLGIEGIASFIVGKIAGPFLKKFVTARARYAVKYVLKKAAKRGVRLARKFKMKYMYLKTKLKYRQNKYYAQQRWTYAYYKDKKCKHRIKKIKVQHVNKLVYLKRQ
ncbi:hypothetical protein KCA1_0385 [Lactiplantibacillus pentosus KCA1]|nr:hypothetical protein [Lactiplantibacillus pentosus]EIW14999.1 hypothetical protein KCA1_0385 [Lactiplantibacillus pentosus KCA1]